MRRDKRKAAPVVEGYQFEDVVSGRFDEEDASADAVPPKRVLLPQVETPITQGAGPGGSGFAPGNGRSRFWRGGFRLINEPTTSVSASSRQDQVKVNGKPIRYRIDPPPARVIAYRLRAKS